MKKIYMLFLFVFVLSCLIVGCIDEPIPGIWDPDDKGGPTPVISSITPEGVAYAVSDELIIRGQNFSPVDTHNFVYFNTTKVPVLSASSTELRVMTPNVLGDNVKIKVAVMGAQLFSNVCEYKILPTFIDLGSYGPVDAFYALEVDAAGNVYVQLAAGTTGRIDKIAPDGTTTQYATIAFGTARSMRFAPDGSLYIVRSNFQVARVPPGGGAGAYIRDTLTNRSNGLDLDFDKNGNMWVVGTNSTAANRRVIKLRDGLVVNSYVFNAQLRACKVYNDYLYVAGQDGTDNAIKIWRAAIDGNGDLGAFEVYYNWNSTVAINSLAFATDGTLYAANDGTAAGVSPAVSTVVAISPNKVATPLYPDNLARMTYNLVWGTGEKYIYLTKRVAASGGDANNKIMKVYMAKDGAPYFGRQ